MGPPIKAEEIPYICPINSKTEWKNPNTRKWAIDPRP